MANNTETDYARLAGELLRRGIQIGVPRFVEDAKQGLGAWYNNIILPEIALAKSFGSGLVNDPQAPSPPLPANTSAQNPPPSSPRSPPVTTYSASQARTGLGAPLSYGVPSWQKWAQYGPQPNVSQSNRPLPGPPVAPVSPQRNAPQSPPAVPIPAKNPGRPAPVPQISPQDYYRLLQSGMFRMG